MLFSPRAISISFSVYFAIAEDGTRLGTCPFLSAVHRSILLHVQNKNYRNMWYGQLFVRSSQLLVGVRIWINT